MKKLNFGCGERYKDGYVNVDGGEHIARCDLRFDFEKFPYPITDNTFEYIEMTQVLEHLSWKSKAGYCKSYFAYAK